MHILRDVYVEIPSNSNITHNVFRPFFLPTDVEYKDCVIGFKITYVNETTLLHHDIIKVISLHMIALNIQGPP